MSGTPRDGDAGWLRFEDDQPEPTEVDAGAVDQPDQSSDSAWLGTTCPSPGPTRHARLRQPTMRPGWRPRSTRRPDAAAGGVPRHRVPPTIVREAEESTPAHVSPATRPTPVTPATTARPTTLLQRLRGRRLDQFLGLRRRLFLDLTAATAGRRRRHGPPVRSPWRRGAVGGLAVLGAAIKEFAIVVGMALVLSFIVKTWLIQAFYIPSGSMEDTLVLNDRVIVSKLTPGPFDLKRGDIIVFEDPGHWLDESRRPSEGGRRDVGHRDA